MSGGDCGGPECPLSPHLPRVCHLGQPPPPGKARPLGQEGHDLPMSLVSALRDVLGLRAATCFRPPALGAPFPTPVLCASEFGPFKRKFITTCIYRLFRKVCHCLPRWLIASGILWF